MDQPLDQGQPAVEVTPGVRVGIVEVDRLVLICGRVAVVHQGQVGTDPVGEALQLQVAVEPPPRVLLAEQDHQQRPKD
jgi:hypothetical protein